MSFSLYRQSTEHQNIYCSEINVKRIVILTANAVFVVFQFLQLSWYKTGEMIVQLSLLLILSMYNDKDVIYICRCFLILLIEVFIDSLFSGEVPE